MKRIVDLDEMIFCMPKDGSKILEIKKSEFTYCILIISFLFADILNNGNLNLLYFAGVLLVIFKMADKKYYYIDLILYFIPFIVIPIIFSLFAKTELIFVRAFVYCGKIFICISLLSFFKNNLKKGFTLKKLWTELICAFGAFFLASIILYAKSPFWRINDIYNSFSKTRLQFLFSEPSVLGLLTGIILIFVIYSILEKGFSIKRFFYLTLLAVILLLTFSMSGLLYVTISATYLVFSRILASKGKLRKSIVFILLLVFILSVITFLTPNPISGRINAILHGNDGSFNFRWDAAVHSMVTILGLTNHWGLGLGMMNSQIGLNTLLSTGIDYKFANSFLYFITENGILGVIYIIYILIFCLKAVFNERKIDKKNYSSIYNLKAALFIYIIISQIAGGYFTDPLIWCIYGIICAKGIKQEDIII